MDTGILIHGIHLQANGWDEEVWGDSEQQLLGRIPRAVLSILDTNPDQVALITIGTGASKSQTGVYEAELVKKLGLDNFDQLDKFTQIREHPGWHKSRAHIHKLLQSAATDTASKNTREEIANAAELFSHRHIEKVIEVTGASHAPRCQLEQSVAFAEGAIPRSQRWSLVASDVAFYGTEVGDTAIFEEPHRGDDPATGWPKELHAPRVFKQYFSLPAQEKLDFLTQVDALAKRMKNGPEEP